MGPLQNKYLDSYILQQSIFIFIALMIIVYASSF